MSAADINCSSDLITGTYDDGGSGPYTAATYGSCVVDGSDIVVLYHHSGSIKIRRNNILFSPSAPTPARNLGTFDNLYVVDMGATEPTLSGCITATYSADSVSAVTNNWYCAKITTSSGDTGYMAAKWNGSALITSTLTPPPTLPPVSAPIDLKFNTQVETTSTDIEMK